jgi:hypothetical protein
MQTLQISDQAANNLRDMAQQEHVSSTELVERLIKKYNEELRKQSGRLTDFAGILAGSPSFTENPLDIQKAMRNEWD